ncbi:insulinase family protein [Endozoicomonas gorgoniicola]|uniref:Insulinase family protein n=1 Tax=Endozoicomonas gorgoniicola TaxID=1234144 RepID=A0ABT3N3V1_9GAMM|nr:insulinase family protein [Endozoicomonas gorgoniicola]MCW7556284.1 insulinase family protein [Endozoicomonas gorgoniicola]
MKLLQIFMLAGGVLLAGCQTSPPEQPESMIVSEGRLPLRKDMVSYQLDNGLEIRLLPRSVSEKNVEMRLLVKAGSLQETENERGLAHFVEHMAFKGTEDFPGQESFAQLEKEGISLGAHVNAITSFNSTTYQLSLPDATDKQIDTGLHILSQWAFAMTFDEQAVEKEREVIVEEWRIRQGVGQRINSELDDLRYRGTRMAVRSPIGLIEVVRNAPLSRARAFYERWYQPQNMVLLVAGGFDEDKIATQINDYFGSAVKGKQLATKEWGKLQEKGEKLKTALIFDAEQPGRFVQIMIQRTLSEPMNTVNSQWRDFIEQLWLAILNQRLTLMVDHQQFSRASIREQSVLLSPSLQQHLAILYPVDGDYEDSIRRFSRELHRLAKVPVSQAELDAVRNVLLQKLARKSASSARYSSRYLLNRIMDADSFQLPVMDKHQELEMVTTFLQEVTPSHLQASVQSMLQEARVNIALIGPDSDRKKIQEQTVASAWEQGLGSKVGSFTLRHQAVDFDLIPSGSTTPASKQLLNLKGESSSGTGEKWVLPNGLTILLYSDPDLSDQVQLNLRIAGGRSLETETGRNWISTALNLPFSCGFEEYSRKDLMALNKQYDMSLSPYSELLHHGFRGESSVESLEPLLKVLNMRLRRPVFCQDQLNRILILQKQQMKHLPAERRFMDAITLAAFDHGDTLVLQPKSLAEAPSANDLKQVDQRLLSDPSTMVVSISSRLPVKKMGELASSWLGSLQKLEALPYDGWRDQGVRPKHKAMEQRFPWGSSPKSMVQIQYSHNAQWSKRNQLVMAMIESAVNQRLRQVLRVENSGVYAIHMSQLLARDPQPYYLGRLNFTTAPTKADDLATRADAVVQGLVSKGMTMAEFKQAHRMVAMKRKQQQASAVYWTSALAQSMGDGAKIEELSDAAAQLDSITLDEVNGLMGQVLGRNRKLFVLEPMDKRAS